MSAAAISRLRWAPGVRLETGIHRDRTLAEVVREDPQYVCWRSRQPDPAWTHSLTVAVRVIARELGCVEERAA